MCGVLAAPRRKVGGPIGQPSIAVTVPDGLLLDDDGKPVTEVGGGGWGACVGVGGWERGLAALQVGVGSGRGGCGGGG